MSDKKRERKKVELGRKKTRKRKENLIIITGKNRKTKNQKNPPVLHR